MTVSMRDFLREATCSRQEIDDFLDPDHPNFAAFDPELGYVLKRRSFARNGIDGCYTVTRLEPSGERRRVNYPDRPCRINTYGDSFTQCAQVSDGETWQEYLGAHLGEPIRNFGVGGHGVYHAYRRLLREEAGPSAAPYLIFNIWSSDDHLRNLDAWRWLRIDWYIREMRRTQAPLFHCNPWVHLTVDPDSGAITERPNPYPTPESLYLLCDEDHVYQTFHDDFALQMLFATRWGVALDPGLLRRYAAMLGVPARLDDAAGIAKTAGLVYDLCGYRSSIYVLDRLQAYARTAGKRLLVFLTYSDSDIEAACREQPRRDQAFVDYLSRSGLPWFDGLQAHVSDYACFHLSAEKYVQRYYIGHYRPEGNHFLAMAAKSAVVNWLEPEPPCYAGVDVSGA
jgi:hypothetical protein